MVDNRLIRPKTVVLNITGASKELLSIGLEIRFTDNGKLVTQVISGSLPQLPQQLLDAYTDWKRGYLAWGEVHRYWQRTIGLPSSPIETNINIQNCDVLEEKLIQEFNNWLDVDKCQGLSKVARHIFAHITPVEYGEHPNLLSFIVQTRTDDSLLDLNLQKLPWDKWKFVRDNYNSGIALSTNTAPIIERQEHKLKALVICGKYDRLDNQIDLQPDLNALEQHLRDVVELEIWPSNSEETSKLELLKKLDNSIYHLLFFCGHSSSNNQVQLNNHEYISADDTRFKEILTKLKNRGLILAFFNSCDGLGIARSLTLLEIPYVVVMKESVHDHVAQEFIKEFLEKAAIPEISIHIAVNEAKRKLQWLKGLPHGELLPVLFQNPEQPPLYLNPIIKIVEPLPSAVPVNLNRSRFASRLLLFGLGLLVAVILGIFFHRIYTLSISSDGLPGRISMGEQLLAGSDQGAKLYPAYQDFKSENYKDSFNKFDVYLKENNKYNNSEIVIFRNNARSYSYHKERGTKLIKLAVSVPFGNNRPIARELLRGIAQAQGEYNSAHPNVNIIIKIGNDDNNPGLTEKIARKFVEDTDIVAVIGHNASEASEAGANVYDPANLVMISPTSFRINLKHSRMKSSIYRMVPEMTTFASKLAHYIKENFKYDPLHVGMCVHELSGDNTTFHKQFKYVLQGLPGSGFKQTDLNCKSFNTLGNPAIGKQIINTMIKEKINVLMLAPHIETLPEAVKFMKQVRQHPQLKDIKLVGSPSLYSGAISGQNQDGLLNGLILAVSYFPDPKNQFVINFEKEWREPLDTWRTTMSYAAMHVVTQNLDQTSTRGSVLNKIEKNNIPYNTVNALPPFSFNSEHIISSNSGQLIQLAGTKYDLIETK
jgi:branched-chain amino acid transport system substrate-binding protein